MSWPLSQDYNEAIQSPQSNFTDPDLKRGEAATNALGLPAPYSGNFADVYQVRCPDGKSWAVKCFTREAVGLRERYQEISAHLKQAKLPFTVDFSYLEKGMRVAGQWYPVLKMQWVEGLTLNQFIGQNLEKPVMLEALLQLWARMGKYLRAAEIGHCDLQHGNVLLVPGATPKSLALKLIDYDGMWVPGLAGSKSGEVGHANYQHPRRLREGTYSLDVDRFPLLLVATAMRALKADKGLWAKYDNGDNMLFKESDLAAPAQSEVFEELASLPDAGLVMLAAHVRAALKAPLESAPLLEDAMPDAKGAAAPAPKRPPKPTASPAADGPRSGTKVAAVVVAPVAAPPAAETAFAFDESAPAAGVSSTRLKRTKPIAKEKAGGLPLWASIAGAAALGVVLVTVGGLTMWALSGRSNSPKPPDKQVVQNTNNPKPPPPDPKTPPPKDKPPVDPIDHNPPPPVVIVPDPAPVTPTVKEVKNYGVRHAGPIRSLCISRDGKRCLSLGSDKIIWLLDLDSGFATHSYNFPNWEPTTVAFSPDGKSALFGGGDKVVHLFDLEKGTEIRPFKGKIGAVTCADVSPDGKQIIAVSEDGTICLWDLDKGTELHSWKAEGLSPRSVRFVDDAKAVTYHDDQLVRCWDVKTGNRLWVDDGANEIKPVSIGTGADGKRVPVGETAGMAVLTDAVRNISYPFSTELKGPTRAVALSRDGRFFAMAVAGMPNENGGANVLQVWDLKLDQAVGLNRVETPAVCRECLVFAPDGRRLIAAFDDGSIRAYAISGAPAEQAPPVATGPDALSFDSGWDKPVDPDGDCKFTPDNNALTIEVPGNKEHGLAVERAVMNGPRVLRDLEGDFTIQVHVSGDFRPVGPSTSKAAPPYVAGGLVVMADDRTYIRLDRAAFMNAMLEPFVNWDARVDGQWRQVVGGKATVPDGPIYLRLTRIGDRFIGSYSLDGTRWTNLSAQDVKMPAKVKIGLAAHSTSSVPFKPRFEDCSLTGGGQQPAVPVKADKRKPPVGDELAKALEEVKATFKDGYDGLSTAKEAYTLSGKLLAEAHLAKDKPDRQYALLLEARDLAARGENLATSLEIIDETAAAYAVNVQEARTAALLAAGKTFSNRAAAKAYLDAAIPLLEQARADDDYDLVAPLLPALRQAYSDAKQPELTKTAGALAAQIEHLQGEYKAVQPALATLKEKPDDADANLAAGKFYALQKQDWDRGAPMLAKSSDAALSEAALKEAGPPATAMERAAAGDAWWKAGESTPMFKPALRRRAQLWYEKALPDLSGKDEERVQARVIDLTKEFPDFVTAWADLDVSKAEVVGNCYLRLRPGQSVALKQPPSGPTEFHVVLRADKLPVKFDLRQSKDRLIGTWEIREATATLTQQVGLAKQNFIVNTAAAANTWLPLSCRFSDRGLEYQIGDKLLLVIGAKYDASQPLPFMVEAIDQPLEIQSLTVKPLKP